LAAETEEDEVVAGEEGVDDLRDDGVIVAVDAGKQRAAFAEAGDEVIADLVFDGAAGWAALCPLAGFPFP
jgi:predicted transcriptional regulator